MPAWCSAATASRKTVLMFLMTSSCTVTALRNSAEVRPGRWYRTSPLPTIARPPVVSPAYAVNAEFEPSKDRDANKARFRSESRSRATKPALYLSKSKTKGGVELFGPLNSKSLRSSCIECPTTVEHAHMRTKPNTRPASATAHRETRRRFATPRSDRDDLIGLARYCPTNG